MLQCRTLPRTLFGILATVIFVQPSLAQRAGALLAQDRNANSSQIGMDAEAALQKGISLTRQGLFQLAITPLLQAQGRVVEEYAAAFNLALCYFGTGNYGQSIEILNGLRSKSYNTVAVNNLLAQDYVGNRQPEQAMEALTEASKEAPEDEKLYAYVADACTDHYEYALGLKVVGLG